MKVTRRLLTLSTLVFICALPACITGPYFPAPTILKDGANIRWAFDLERPGTLAALPTDTSPSVFMSSFDIRFGGSTVNYDAITERRLGRREELFPPETATGTVKISGRRFVPESDFFCRYYFVVENTGAAPVTDDIVVYIVPHAGANFNVVNTADGDGFVEAGENWLVASLATPATADDLSTALVWGDETSTLAPAVGLTPTDVTLTFSGVTIPAGSSITFVLYGIAHKSTTVLAGQAARISAGLAPQCAVGFSAAEMAQIRNFTFDSDGDGMGDGWEMAYTYTVGVNDGAADKDADQIPGWQEFMLNANPIVQDSDNDKLSDRDEFYTHGTDLATKDSDGDRVTDRFEVTVGKNPLDGSDGAFRYFSGSNNWATQPSIAFDANKNVHLFCSEYELDVDGFPNSDPPVFVYRMLSPTGEVLIDRTVIDIGAEPDEGPGMSAVTVLPTGRVVVTVLRTDSMDGDSLESHLVYLELNPRFHPQNGTAGTHGALVVVEATPLDDPDDYTSVPRQYLANDGTLRVLFFNEGDLHIRTRQADGTWLPVVPLLALPAPAWDTAVDLAGRVHIVFSPGSAVLYMCMDSLTGTALIAPTQVLDDPDSGNYNPSVLVDEQGIVYVLATLSGGIAPPTAPPAIPKGPPPIMLAGNSIDFISFNSAGHPFDGSTINITNTAVVPQTQLEDLELHSPLGPTTAFDSRGYIRVITHDSQTDEIHHSVYTRDGALLADVGQVSRLFTYTSMTAFLNESYFSEAQMIFGSGRAAWATQFGKDEYVTVVDALDFDGDTMDDVYEFIHFGGLDHDGLDDTDGDGYTDAEEAFYDSNPNDPTSQPPPQAPGLLGAFGGGGGCLLNDNAQATSWWLSLFPLLLVLLWRPRREENQSAN